MTVADGSDLFTTDRGARSQIAAAALALTVTAAISIVVRAALDELDPSGDHGMWSTVAAFCAVAGIMAAIAALFDIATRARRGRGTAKAALGLGIATALVTYVYNATVAGTLRLDNFIAAFADTDILGSMAGDLVRGAKNTLMLALTAEVLSLLLGLVIAIVRLSPRRWARWPAAWYVDLIRATPLIVLASLINGGLPKLGLTLSAFAVGTAALTLNAGAYVAEIFRAGLQSVPRGQADAARSLGMPYAMSMLYVVIPQAVRNVVPPLMSEFVALLKDTAIVVAITGFTPLTADLFGTARTTAASTFSPTPFIGATLGYIILLIPLIRVVDRAERRIRAGYA